ncbi:MULTISPECIES: lipid-A-disaccharide synthase [unclassified Helicobacter]|uniref:lipid-A-disaccharide synthase n=1 Tax=unclassified Helicobacter TaxID=2593540 RepID=UPI000CF181C0|nr:MULTISPECIES: lipid-A-disaccharide synthase [unclassified Helicobacter]
MKILVSALESSSNEHLKTLMQEFNEGEIELFGIFDSSLGKPLYTPKDFSVMGILDVLKKVFFFMQVQKQMLELAEKVDLVLLLDASSFHIPLAKKIKKKFPNKPIVYYILPQVWAWKSWRAKVIESNCDKLGAILPFEVDYYKHKASYVGHPLLDSIKQFKQSCGGSGIVFMPGSRRSEIRRIFPIFYDLGMRYFRDKEKILIVPKLFKEDNLQEIYGDGVKDFVISYDSRESLLNAEFAFICSGTATLESAIVGTPFVLGYKTSKFDYFFLSKMTDLKYIGLANIFFNALNKERPGRGDSKMHPELVQDAFNVENLFAAYQNTNQQEFFKNSKQIREYLRFGSAKNIAQWIRDLSY